MEKKQRQLKKECIVRQADNAATILSCFTVMKELRPHLEENDFVETIQRMQKNGFHLVFIEYNGKAVSAAGFEMGEKLHRGKYLYIDDLTTLPAYRSQGYGSSLLDWIFKFAAQNGCQQVHLDSGVQRFDAHRLYLNKGFIISSHHFMIRL